MIDTISYSMQIYKAVKGYGTRRVLRLLMVFSYYFLPILFCVTLYNTLGDSFFTEWFLNPIISILISVLIIILCTYAIFTLIQQLRVFKTFVNRINEASSHEHRDLALGYLYFPKLHRLSILSPKKSKMFTILPLVRLGLSIFVSFYFVAFLSSYRESLIQMFSLILTIIPSVANLAQVQLLIIISWLFFLPFCIFYFVKAHPLVETIWASKKLGVRISNWSYLEVIVDSFSIINRISTGLHNLIWLFYRSHFQWVVLNYPQFPIPYDLTKIIMRTHENIQGESCNVYHYEVKFDREDEGSRLFRVIDKYYSEFTKFFPIIEGKSKFVTTLINKHRGTLYIGFLKQKMVFFGYVYYFLKEPARTAIFSFNNRYTSKEFQEIVNIQMIKNREI